MNRLRLLGAGAALLIGLAVSAQQVSNNVGTVNKGELQAGVPNVEQHLRALSEKLNLTSDQQAKMKPVLEEYFYGRQKLLDDKKLSEEERSSQLKALHEKADRKAREFLNDDQKKKLDELERDSHQDSQGR
jgi:Spy/CpxP family protein refolding chaperone